jgi:hypothetical protein
VSADKIEAAVAAYAAHINRENREQLIQADADWRGLAWIDKAVAGIMAAIEDGFYQPAMKARMAELAAFTCGGRLGAGIIEVNEQKSLNPAQRRELEI